MPVILGLLLAWHSLTDRDVWFHARAGADLLEDGHLAQTNRYSFTAPEHPWLNHEWLFQTAIAATAPAIPPREDDPLRAWSLLRTLLSLGLVLVLIGGDGLTRRDHPTTRLAIAAAAALAGLGMLWTRLTLRPELVSYLLLVVAVRGVEGTLAAPAVPWRWWLDPRRAPGRAVLATLLWAQVHGFAALAPLVWVLAAGLATPAGGRRRAIRHAFIGCALALAALAATPNGPAGLLFPLRALGQFGSGDPGLSGMISELAPLTSTRDALGGTIVLAKLSFGWTLLWIVTQRRRIPRLRAVLTLLAAVAAWQAQRALGLYAVCFVLLHTGTASPLQLPRWAASPRLGRAATTAVAVAVVVIGALWGTAVVSDRFYLREGVARRFGSGLNPAHAPTASLAALGAAGSDRVLANVDAAGLVLAARAGRVFIDGRTEAYPASLWRQYAALREGGAAASDVLEQWRPEAVLLAYGSGAFAPLAAELLASPRWRLEAVDGAAVLLRPGEGPAIAPGPAAAALLDRSRSAEMSSARRADYCLAASRLLGLVGDRSGAAAALAAGVAIRPDHPQLQHNLGNALMAQERFGAALAAFAAALAANGRQAGSALNAGVCALRLDRAAEAASWFERSAAIDPERFQAWVNLATARLRLGDRAGARDAMQRAVELRPDDPVLRERLRAL